ncbi:MAG: hypothetical protein P4L84_05060 [Isosphaeraceae bacterium]|nr:hypothetical protein [Isosphaeraceae bacterium]
MDRPFSPQRRGSIPITSPEGRGFRFTGSTPTEHVGPSPQAGSEEGAGAQGLLAANVIDAPPPYRLRLDPGHPWRPPFGLERIGRPIAAVVEASEKPATVCTLAAFRAGKEVNHRTLTFTSEPPYVARTTFNEYADELVLSAGPKELARQAIHPAKLEADASARPDRPINPVDLGTIFVPSGTLLLGPGQSATVDVAAISRTETGKAGVRAWFESAPGRVATASLDLRENIRAQVRLALPEAPQGKDRDRLHVTLDDGRELWRKTIPVMLVAAPASWPKFGATSTHLRYDLPISVRDSATGTFSTLPYEKGWTPDLKDIVVSLPTGARFVFWRGSSYIPFWAGEHNTGACFEWAEMLSRPEGAVDCVEPLMDKTLRYGRIAIVESTPARVHVRWSYQSTDLKYQVWGDSAVEDYYFYPDGFGTRVVNLKCDPKNDYELNEFIVLTPPDAYPFEVLPENLVDALFLDGRKREFRFPYTPAKEADGPAIYRLRLHKENGPAAVEFSPNLRKPPPVIFGSFRDGGEVVTPCYWGSHWPLARGNATGSTIDDRVHVTPCHNSVMSWAAEKPAPLRSGELITVDALGRARPMSVRQWAWLIGMSDASDERLVAWAKSYAAPPSLDVRGARLDFDAYAPERRALRLVVESRDVVITFKPGPPCVNPVFELAGAPKASIRVALAGRPLENDRYAWDGQTLWLDATIELPTELSVTFSKESP